MLIVYASRKGLLIGTRSPLRPSASTKSTKNLLKIRTPFLFLRILQLKSIFKKGGVPKYEIKKVVTKSRETLVTLVNHIINNY